MLSPNTILQHRYRIIRRLGQGGMGAVYEAIDERVSCVVAVKETLAATEDEARRAFEREAALLANLRHAALPKVMDHFNEDEGQFLVMEFVPGYDLAELMEMRGARFPPAQVLQWADELLKVLEYLHGREPPILHRDIKPSNLKLTRQGEIFLLDFGLAKGSAGQMPTLLTSRSVRGYTPVYASLEQIHGKGTDPRSDLYSLGATLYHLLTGVAPVDAPTRFDAAEDEQPDPLPPIDELNPQVAPAVAAVIHQALAVSRKARPANAAAMRRALLEAVEESRRRPEQIKPAPIIPAPTQPAKEVEASPARQGMGTLRVKPDKLYRNAADLKGSQTGEIAGHEKTVTDVGSYRALMLAALFVLAVVTTIAVAWMMKDDTSSGDQNQQQASAEQASTVQSPGGKASGPTPPAGMAYVPGGEFMMGRDGDETGYESPAHRVAVKPFYMDIYEVTNEEYAKFIKAIGRSAPPVWGGNNYPAEAARMPVTGITWEDANAYARWAGKRLPTEEEWEFAARGTDGRRYPWGNDWRAGLANAGGAKGGMVEAGAYKGSSPFGLFDMAGNAWEWTASRLTPYPGGSLPIPITDDVKVIRGGTFSSNRSQATTTYRRGWHASSEEDYGNTGFRCAKDITPR